MYGKTLWDDTNTLDGRWKLERNKTAAQKLHTTSYSRLTSLSTHLRIMVSKGDMWQWDRYGESHFFSICFSWMDLNVSWVTAAKIYFHLWWCIQIISGSCACSSFVNQLLERGWWLCRKVLRDNCSRGRVDGSSSACVEPHLALAACHMVPACPARTSRHQATAAWLGSLKISFQSVTAQQRSHWISLTVPHQSSISATCCTLGCEGAACDSEGNITTQCEEEVR